VGVSENNRKARFYKLTPEGRKQLDKEQGNSIAWCAPSNL